MKKIYLFLSLITFMLMIGCNKQQSSTISEEITTEAISEEVSTEEISSETINSEVPKDEEAFETSNTIEDTVSTEESSSEIVDDSVTTTEESSSNEDNDKYIGKFLDVNEKESDMIISKKEDGTYKIEITRFRLTSMECTGTLTDEGIKFAEDNSPTQMEGIININGNLATVTFTNSTWDSIKVNDSFRYEKVE